MNERVKAWVLLTALVCAPAAVAFQRTTVSTDQLTRSRSPAMLRQQAQSALDRKEYAEAARLLAAYLDRVPDDAAAHVQLGYALTALERWTEAEQEYRRATELDPKLFAAQLNFGLALLRHDPAAAVGPLRQACLLAPKELRPRLLLAAALERSGQKAQAAEEYRHALELDPRNFTALYERARLLLELGQTADAEAGFRQALTVEPRSPQAHLGLAETLRTEGRLQEAADHFQKYLTLNPTDDAARLHLADLQLRLEQPEQALATLNRIPENSAVDAVVFHRLRAEAALALKQYSQAQRELEAALAQAPETAELEALLGKIFLLQQNYPAARAHLLRALHQQPQLAAALQDLVATEYLSGDYAAALASLDRLSRVESLTPISWFIRATCLDHLGRWSEATQAYRTFLTLSHGAYDREEFQARQRLKTLERALKKK